MFRIRGIMNEMLLISEFPLSILYFFSPGFCALDEEVRDEVIRLLTMFRAMTVVISGMWACFNTLLGVSPCMFSINHLRKCMSSSDLRIRLSPLTLHGTTASNWVVVCSGIEFSGSTKLTRDFWVGRCWIVGYKLCTAMEGTSHFTSFPTPRRLLQLPPYKTVFYFYSTLNLWASPFGSPFPSVYRRTDELAN